MISMDSECIPDEVDDHEYADVCVTSPDIILGNCYHPSLTPNHKAFTRLPIRQQVLLERLQRQCRKWNHKPYFRGSVPNTTVAIVNGYSKADRLLNCMMVDNKYNASVPYGRCNLINFCPYCAYLKGQDLLKKYARAWRSGCWYWMVLSHKHYVCVSDTAGDSILDVWEAIRACIKEMKPLFGGFIAWEELAVNSFWPEVLCTPHTNLLIRHSSQLDVDAAAQRIATQWLASTLSVLPNAELSPVLSPAHFHKILTYVKPIDVLTPYNTGYQATKGNGEREMFHQNVRCFFEGYAVNTTEYHEKRLPGRRRKRQLPITRRVFLYGGNCHGSASRPLGIRPAQRRTKAHQALINLMVMEGKEDELASRINDDSEEE